MKVGKMVPIFNYLIIDK